MRPLILLLSTVTLLAFPACATRPVPLPVANLERAAAARGRYWAQQTTQEYTPKKPDYETLLLVRPERSEQGVIHTPSTDCIRIPRLP